MFYLFTIIYIFCVSYILFKKRNIDLFTILFGGLFYYSSPLLIGNISMPGIVYNQEISITIYVIFSFSFLMSLYFMIKNDKREIINLKT